MHTQPQSILRACRAELKFGFVRASGPGGQNVNKVSTAVQLHFDVQRSHSLDSNAKHRLMQLGGKRMTSRGILVIEARRHRSQELNRQEALARFERLVLRALERPKARHATQPTLGSQEQRLRAKKRRSEVKRARAGANLDS